MTSAPAVSLVLVAYRSSGLLPAAVAAFRRQAAELGLAAQVVVVDHSEDADELERLRAALPDQLLSRPNRGYAAGVNAGLEAARGERLLVGNPDVELHPGALAALLAALDDGWGVVGPQLELAGWLFPAADEQSARAEVARRRAAGGGDRWRRFLRRELARWSAVWEATAPVTQPMLSGALLAFSRDVATRLGPWDEGYFLYFEETDWLRGARQAGVPLALVPAARASHRWGHAARPTEQGGRFALSQQRYYQRHFPRLSPLLARLPTSAPPAAQPWASAPQGAGWRWLLSPSPLGFPAALLDRAEADAGAASAAAAAFVVACAPPGLVLLAWRPEDGALLGPFEPPRAAAG